MKKNALALLLTAALALTCLTGCGSSSSTTPAAGSGTASSAAASSSIASGVRQGTITEGKLIVTTECASAPNNWTQPTDANGAVPIKDSPDYTNGYDIMIAKYICEQLGWELEIVKSDWESIIPAIQSSTVDVAIANQSITSERLEMVDFSDPYYYASIVAIVKEDSKYADAVSLADLAGGTCTSQLNTVWYDCLSQIPDANILPGQETNPAMIVALTSGRVDFVVADQPTALAAIAANPGLKMLEFEGDNGFDVSDEDINIGISMLKGNTELKDAINSVLATLTVDDFTAMMNEAISIQPLSE